MAEQRFAVVRLGSLGDIVHTFPAVAGLRKSFPQAEILWLTHPRWKDLVACSGLPTEILPVDSRDLASVRQAVAAMRKRKFEAAIDYQGLWKSALLPALGGIARRIGFANETIREYGVPVLYTDRVHCHTTHIADQNGELTLQAGATCAVAPVSLQVPEKEEERLRVALEQQNAPPYVVLSPGGGWRSKCWPAKRFGALAQKIAKCLGLRCVVNYGPGDTGLFNEVFVASGDVRLIPHNGNLRSLMALLKNAACVVGGDTGPLHLAVALGAPVVALFGPTDPLRNGPYPQGTVLRSASAVTSYHRMDETDTSLLDLSVDQVFEAVKMELRAHA